MERLYLMRLKKNGGIRRAGIRAFPRSLNPPFRSGNPAENAFLPEGKWARVLENEKMVSMSQLFHAPQRQDERRGYAAHFRPDTSWEKYTRRHQVFGFLFVGVAACGGPRYTGPRVRGRPMNSATVI